MPKIIDLTVLESMAAKGLSQVECAKAVGMSDAGLIYKLQKDAAVRSAYNRGRSAAGKPSYAPRDNGSAKASSKSTAAKPSKKMPKLSGNEQKVYDVIVEGYTSRSGIASASGLPYPALEPILHNLQFEHCVIESWEDGMKIEHYKVKGEASPAPTPAGAKTKAAKNGRRKGAKKGSAKAAKSIAVDRTQSDPPPSALSIHTDSTSARPDSFDEVKRVCQGEITLRIAHAEALLATAAVCLSHGDYLQAVSRLTQLQSVGEFSNLERDILNAASNPLTLTDVMEMDSYVSSGEIVGGGVEMAEETKQLADKIAEHYYKRVGRNLRQHMTRHVAGVCPLSDLQLGRCAGAARQEYTSTVIQMGIALFKMKHRTIVGRARIK